MDSLQAAAVSGSSSTDLSGPTLNDLLAEKARRQSLQTSSIDDLQAEKARRVAPAPTAQSDGLLRQVGVAATGFNKGLAVWTDGINEGLKMAGLPMNDEPFMGSAFVDKYLGGAQFTPQNPLESILQRAGLEVGANAPLLAGALTVQAGAAAVKAAGAQKMLAADTKLQALKTLPAAMAQQLAEIGPSKLAALESLLAAGAGTGAGIVRTIFPEGGRLAEFAGELMGSFAPSVVLGLVGKAREMVGTVGRAVVGLETQEQTKRRLAGKLREAATPEQVASGVADAEALRQEVSPGAVPGEGLALSSGEAIRQGSVTTTQLSQERASVKLSARLRDQRAQNVEAVRNYFNATAPDGNTTRFVEQLETARRALVVTGEADVARTQAHLDAVRGDISSRAANVLTDMESRMFAADQVVHQRLRSIGPVLGKKERGEVIRSAYQEEVGKFRERAKSDYAELDNLGHAELPVASTVSKLADLEAQFPGQIQAIRKMNPRVASAIDALGHDYELLQRVNKAQADLEAVGGKGVDQRGGFKIFTETTGRGGTQDVTGIPSNYPSWYKSMANQKVSGTENVLDRGTIENALDALKTGASHGLHDKTIEYVKTSILADSEFRNTAFFEPVMDELRHTPSASLRDIRQVRSDLLWLSRHARASDDRAQNYVLQELIGSVDRDIDMLLPGQSAYATQYPLHGTRYREISTDYRAGVETLMKGTANKVRRVNRYGDYTQDDESLPALFWRNETTLQDFTKAFQNQDMAKLALRDYALERFTEATAKRGADGRLTIDASASEEWIRQHRPQLKMFPDLDATFKNTAKMQERADLLREQVEVFRAGKKGDALLRTRLEAERRPGDFAQADIVTGEARLKHAQDVQERTLQEWDASKASLFLKTNVQDAGYKIATASDPIAEYDLALSMVKRDPDAVRGLNRSIWEGLTEKIQPRMLGVTGEANLGVFHQELQRWIEGHGQIMSRVLGAEGFQRIKTASDVIERIAAGKKPGSDTAINLQVQAALASTWLSRAFAISSGRVGHVFGITERVANHLTKTFERMTARQQEDILLESFFDPKVYQTLVNAGTYGPENAMVRQQLRLHLLNLSEQRPEDKP